MKVCPHCGEAHKDDVMFCPKTGKAISVSRISQGTLIDGKYKVVRRVASGGMGAVYEAVHKRIGRRVAIKLILPELASSKEMTQRFEREARAASAIGHSNIVEVFDLGTTQEGLPFLVMEFLDGKDLGALIEERGALSVPVAKHIIGQVLDALSEAHAQKIIHRDMKPENVFLVSRGDDPYFVKLLDFGISKMCGGEEAKLHLTSTGLILGTPFYMSPEQARGEKTIDHRSDLFSAGTMFYQALTGKRPFTAENLNQLLYQIIGGKIVPPLEANPEMPLDMEKVLLKALAIDTEDRFASAKEFKAAVFGEQLVSTAEIQRHQSKRAKSNEVIAFSQTIQESTPGSISSPFATPMAWTGGKTTEETPKKSRRLLGVVFGGLFVLAVVMAFSFFLRSESGKKVESLNKSNPVAQSNSSSGAGDNGVKASSKDQSDVEPEKNENKTIRVKLSLDPKDAQVYLDGNRVEALPLEIMKGPEEHKLLVKKEGYVPKTLPIKAEADQILVISLTKSTKSSRRVNVKRQKSKIDSRARPRERDPQGKRDIKAIIDI